jgi:Tfp pilus assembly protein PilF
VAFGYAVLPRLRTVVRDQRRAALVALAVSLVIASWWPVTSSIVNDGDVIGFSAARKARLVFGNPYMPRLARSLDQIDMPDYAARVAASFYGVWGWGMLFLSVPFYVAAYLCGGVVVGLLWSRRRRFVPLYLLLFLINGGLLLYYAATYDYQWQGRYLFPFYFVALGATAGDLAAAGWKLEPGRYRTVLLSALAALVVTNVAATVSLAAQLRKAEAAHAQRGLGYLTAGKLGDAREQFEAALEVNPEDAVAHNGLGIVKVEAGALEQAEAHFRRAVALDPENTEPRSNLANCLLRQRRYREAVSELKEILRAHPRSAAAHLQLSVTYQAAGDRERALLHCRRALKIEPQNAQARALYERLKVQ